MKQLTENECAGSEQLAEDGYAGQNWLTQKTGREDCMGRKPDWRFAAGCVVSAGAFGVVIGLFLNGVTSIVGRAGEEGAETLREGITRACVQCYAIEGRYPPSIDYLREQYGVQIDEERYYVFYDGFASNLMPDITVIPAEEEE